MKQEIQRFKIKDVYDGFKEGPEGIVGFSGFLDIQPPFQREFIYPEDKQVKVIETILSGCNLGLFTWFETGSGTYALGDGKQRTMSSIRFLQGKFTIPSESGPKYFHNLTSEQQETILDYELYVVVVSGTPEERLKWFKTINTAGLVLTDQEMRNASYTGEWLDSAKQYFSKPNCPAYNIGSKYLNGTLNRQDYLETALIWISDGKPEEYMAKHQNDKDASELWSYFDSVIGWVKKLFPTYRKEMKGLVWGKLYNAYKSNTYDSAVLENEIKRLMMDDDVTKKSGSYLYVLDPGRCEKVLSIRAFTESQKTTAYERQGGICPKCGKHFDIGEMEGDHILPWSKGGKTVIDNLQMLCKDCNRTKSSK